MKLCNREHNRSVNKVKKDAWEGVFHFQPDDGIYRDHFPGYPVVPGSLVIHAFLTAGREAGIAGDSFTIENFRFREFLLPGCHPFRMELRGDALHCSIIRDKKKLVTGVLKR